MSIDWVPPFSSYIRKFQPTLESRWKKTQPWRLPAERRLNSGACALPRPLMVGLTQASMVKDWLAGGLRAGL